MPLQIIPFEQRLQFWLQFAPQPPLVTISHPFLTVQCADYTSADQLLQKRCILKRIWTGQSYCEQPTVLELWAKGRRYDRIPL